MTKVLSVIFLGLLFVVPGSGHAEAPAAPQTQEEQEMVSADEEWWEEWDETQEPVKEATPPEEEIKKKKKIPVVAPVKNIPPAAKK